jgi:SAM-dependent methyltransferase
MDRKDHWERVYQTKSPSSVSWYQPHAERSLDLIRECGAEPDDPIIDIGGGASILADDLLTCGFRRITVLDVSQAALQAVRDRLGARGDPVTWIVADVTTAELPQSAYRVWHDRAAFHFLTLPEERGRYVDAVRHALRPGGHVIIATFALDGPERCSGLEVMRYDPERLHDEFGRDFRLLSSVRAVHFTPTGGAQQFVYCVLMRR